MSFLKLDSGIIDSSLWPEPAHVRILFLTMGLVCDRGGKVYMAAPALARKACITVDEAREGLARLEAPDPDSRSKAHDGARIVRIEGGWWLVNYELYRMKDHSGALRQADYRAKRAKRDAEAIPPEDGALVESNAPAVTIEPKSRKDRYAAPKSNASYAYASVSGSGEEGEGEGGPGEGVEELPVRPEGSPVNPLVGDTRGEMNKRALALVAEIAERYTLDQATVWKRACRWQGNGRPPNYISRVERVPDDRMLHVMDELESWAAKDRAAAPPPDHIPVQPMAARLWAAVMREMKGTLDAHTWTTWLAPCFGRRLINKSLEVVVPNETFRKWVDEQYTEPCSKIAERPVVFVVGKWVD